MASAITRRFAAKTLQRRLYGAVAHAPKAAAQPSTPGEVQVGKASNGVHVATQENDSALARVVCAVKAGSRYEDPQQRGVTHCLRVISDCTQREVRAFRLTRELQQMAANISCSASREHLVYTLDVLRSNLDTALPFLLGMVGSPSLRPWEITDSMPRLEYELLALAEQPDKRVVEKVHEVAYRNAGLGRSIYAPIFQLPEFSPDLLSEYMGRYFTPDRVSFSATGVDHDAFLAAVGKMNLHATQTGSDVTSKFHGGEVRESSEDLLAYTVLVGEGASVASGDVWAFAALEQLLGSGPQIKWASNKTSNRVNAALSTKTQDPFHVQSFNVNYTDSGLFGVSAVTVPENSDMVLRTAVAQLKELASKPVDADVLQGAKNRVKSTVAFQTECGDDANCSRAMELIESGKVTDLSDTLSAVEAVTPADVQNAAKKAASRLSMASIGEIHNVPYIDQL